MQHSWATTCNSHGTRGHNAMIRMKLETGKGQLELAKVLLLIHQP
jgi:hypothetical protein